MNPSNIGVCYSTINFCFWRWIFAFVAINGTFGQFVIIIIMLNSKIVMHANFHHR